ncbi:unnamed protein product [Adineta steineri]|uniref:PKD/REJ-like domain-containing protein n=1 Tax=Adineta steineri TaxID=433720 RepID=A0A813VXZ1_9BILA|nr:unnamed protein product [Adineta steineri]
MIQFNCDGSLSTTRKWTIKNCTSNSCSFEIVLNENVMTTYSELYIPSRTLAYGVYQLTLTVTMIDSPNLKSSSSVYVRITATGITANLVQLGTSMITRGDQQDLLLDPGTFSVDPDEDTFDATKWKYTYYCRIYDLYNFPNLQGILLSIGDSTMDPYNPSCLSHRSGNGTKLIFGNLTLSPNSSLTVLSGSLQSNQIYQFMVYMENRKNSSIQATGYVLVTIEVTHPQLIAVGCVISPMCVPNLEFQLLNPTTQVALFTVCIGTCTNLQSIKWNIYQGSDNSTSSNSTQWILFNNTILYENIWFFGTNTSNFTATDQLFLNNLQISLWRFEVVYTFLSAIINTKSLNSNSNIWTIAAGTGCAGSTSNTLHDPRGIFVDTDLNLYVADCTNNRVQKFLSQQVNGITLAGTGATGTISLNCPTGIALDADNYVFIADYFNNRIVGSGPNGFRCLVGCSTVAGSASNQLYYPSSLSFDSYDATANQPSFCPSTTWYTNAITFANISTVGTHVFGVFVGIDNTIYVANPQTNKVVVWFEGSINPDKILSGSLSSPYDLFATPLGDIYVDNGGNGRVDKFALNSNISNSAMSIPNVCYGMFVDISNTLYCAAYTSHQVVKKWLNDNVLTSTIVAGTGTSGSTATTLNTPVGIFVDTAINLYIADSNNNRIQMFPVGQFTGITLAGASAPGTITLNVPNGIALDGNGYLFIADCFNQRIVGSGPYGFRCLFGCTNIAGSSSSQLYYPVTIRFDSYGNIFVGDKYNNRVQKFLLASNSCSSISHNQPTFCSNALWYSNASTFASSSTIGTLPYGIFINGINTVYVPNRVSNTILSWPQGITTSTSNSYSNLSNPYSLFMSMTGDIYIDNGYSYGRVDKYAFNTSNRVTVMNVNGSCFGLFIDINNNLYCSLKNLHQVVKLLLNNGTTIPTIAAGNGSAGSLSNMLNSPQGIYVDSSLNLYIADSANNRIQFIQTGQLNGVAIAGNGSSANITLNYPTGIVLDANGYLFIVDSYNHRIVASSYYGFRCIVGCSGGGSSSSQLSFPQSMAFDSYGNIYVTDRNNSRQYRPPLPLRAAAAVAVPQLALLLLPPLRLQAVAVLQVPLPPQPVPQVQVLQAVAVLRVPLPPPPVPLVALPLAVLLLVVAVPPAALLLLPPVLQVVLLLPPQVPLLLLLPPQLLQRVAVAPQVALLPLLLQVLRQVVAVLQVVLLRAAAAPQVPRLQAVAVSQVALLRAAALQQVALLLPLQLPPPVVPLRAVAAPQVPRLQAVAAPQVPRLQAVPQVALQPPPQVLQQVAAVPQVVLLLPVLVLQVPPQPRPPLAVPLRAVAAPQVAVRRVVAVLQLVLPRAAVVLQVASLPLPPAVPQLAPLQAAAVLQVAPLLRPPLAVPLQAVAALQVVVPQLVLPLPLVVPQVARHPSQLLKD